MAESSSRQFHLADLVAAILFCGVLAAIFVPGSGTRDPQILVVLLAGVLVLWLVLRFNRAGPTCTECGRRFQPEFRSNPSIHCQHCGEPQAPIRQAIVGRSLIFCVIAVLLFISVMGALAFAVQRDIEPLAPRRFASLAIALAFALVSGLAIAWFLKTPLRSAQAPVDRICEGCGNVIPGELRAPTICRNCRARKLTRDEFKNEQSKGSRSVVLSQGILAIAGIAALFVFARSMIESRNWIGLGFAGLLSIAGFAYAWGLIVWLLRNRRLSGLLDESAALATARACAGEEGTIVKDGSTTIWYSGPDEPVPMLRKENAAAHRRFTAMVGDITIPDSSLCILCFHDRDALAKLYKTLFPHLDFSKQLGVCFQRPWNIITLCTGLVPGHLDDPRLLAGSLYCSMLIEQVFGQLSAPWLQVGFSRALAADRRRSDLIALNRRMLAGRAQAIEFSQDLFAMSARKMWKLLLPTKNPQCAWRSEQFLDQTWSTVEFLAGTEAPESRKAAFRAFLNDKQASRRHEETFFQHFGFGFGSLLDSWREWVTEQGRGPDEPPAPQVRDALINRVLPVIRDRIKAIRDWSRAGAALGADSLIDLLRDPGNLPKDELVWSLCRASGMPWDNDPDHWQTWWGERCNELQTM